MLNRREEMMRRKVLLVDDMMDGGWSTTADDPEQKLFLLGYQPFIENNNLFRDGEVSSYITTGSVRPELEHEFSDICFDGDWEKPLVVSSTHLLYVHSFNFGAKMLVEGFIRDWVLRFGRTWESTGKPLFPDLRCVGSLRVREFDDDGQGFVVEVKYSSSFAYELVLRKTDIDKRKWMKWRD